MSSLVLDVTSRGQYPVIIVVLQR